MWVARMLQHSVFCMIWMATENAGLCIDGSLEHVEYNILSYLHAILLLIFPYMNQCINVQLLRYLEREILICECQFCI